MAYYRNYRNYPQYQKKEKTYKQYLHLTFQEISKKEDYYNSKLKELENIDKEFYDFFNDHNCKVNKGYNDIEKLIISHIDRKKKSSSLKIWISEFKKIMKEMIDFHKGKSFFRYIFISQKKIDEPYTRIYDLIVNRIEKFDDILIKEIKSYIDKNFKYELPVFKKNFKIDNIEINFDTTKISSYKKYNREDTTIALGHSISPHHEYYTPRGESNISKNNIFFYHGKNNKLFVIESSPFNIHSIKKVSNEETAELLGNIYWNYDFKVFYKTLSGACLRFISRINTYPFESGYMLFNIGHTKTYKLKEEILDSLSPIQKAKNIIKKKYDDQQSQIKRAKDETAKHKAHSYAYQAKTRELAEEVKREIKSQLRKFKVCPYCEGDLGEVPHADHIYPVSKGGLSTKENMVYICQSCNSSKSDKTLNVFIKSKGFNRDKVEGNLDLLGKDY